MWHIKWLKSLSQCLVECYFELIHQHLIIMSLLCIPAIQQNLISIERLSACFSPSLPLSLQLILSISLCVHWDRMCWAKLVFFLQSKKQYQSTTARSNGVTENMFPTRHWWCLYCLILSLLPLKQLADNVCSLFVVAVTFLQVFLNRYNAHWNKRKATTPSA